MLAGVFDRVARGTSRRQPRRGDVGARVRANHVYLSVNVWPDQLRSTALHELQHLHDLDSGESFTRAELEQRAIAFAARMTG